jgi:phosphoribosylanthranilate isomerase
VTALPRIKICCIASIGEARLAIDCGTDALGLVSEMPSGPGVISEAAIAEIASATPPPIATFLLTSRTDANAIIAQQRTCGVNTIQICDALDPNAYPRLRAALPGVALVQVIHVRGPASVAEASAVAPSVDALLLDSGNPEAAVPELGGTGRVHNWEISREIVDSVATPVFLAGGLTSGNVGEAVARVSPFGVDVCSGVRTGGRLDAAKLKAFVAAALAA